MLGYCFGKSSDSTDSINVDIQGDPLYANNKLGRIQEGLAVFVGGRILRNGDRFLIDFGLDNPNKDIALRVAARVSTNSLGRNTRIRNVWGPEEMDAVVPFHLSDDKAFEIQVLFTVEAIYIALDGLHIAKYNHRLPFHDIRCIEIRGDITDIHVNRNIVTDYPTRPERTPHIARIGAAYADTIPIAEMEKNICEVEETESSACDEYEEFELDASDVESLDTDKVEAFLPLPYYATFPKGFFDLGYTLGVKGYVRLNPHMFKVSLQVGQNVWPQPTVGLVLEFHFNRQKDGETGEPLIARNSFANGKWTGEIKSELSTGLRPGAEFHLIFMRGKKTFEIYMNDKPVTNYPFMVNPKYVDTCFVSGDVKLLSVDIETDN